MSLKLGDFGLLDCRSHEGDARFLANDKLVREPREGVEETEGGVSMRGQETGLMSSHRLMRTMK